MFGLERDFVQQDGITMLLDRPEGLTAGELNMVQARMLMNTGIPHHLRLLLREIDLQVRLEYTVARRKMLGALLKSGKLSMMECFGLMLQIAAGMEEGRLYMLRAEQYVLHEDYIFIEGTLGSGKVFLTYVPLQDIGSAVRPGESLKSLIMVFMAAIHELSGDGMQRLLHYCGEDDFSPAGLKELLAELLTGGEGRRVSPEASGHAPMSNLVGTAPAADRKSHEPYPVRIREELEPRLLEKAPFTWNQGGVKHTEPPMQTPDSVPQPGSIPRLRRKETMPEGSAAADLPEQTLQAAGGTSSYRTYAVLGAVLCDALLWKFLYLNKPGNVPGRLWLIVCAAVTLGLAVVCWMIWSGRLAWGGSEEEEAPGEEDGKNSAFRRPGGELEWDFGRNPVVPLRSPVSSLPRPGEKVPAQADEPADKGAAWMKPDSAGMARGGLQAKEPAAATALLTREPVPDTGSGSPQAGRAAPYLERTGPDDGGIPERIELNRPSFIIGRSAEVAQYVEKSEGASRVHAEIARSSRGYILKDLDSRNGTTLAGEVMVPYKEYPLTEGTVFTIVKGSYTFHT